MVSGLCLAGSLGASPGPDVVKKPIEKKAPPLVALPDLEVADLEFSTITRRITATIRNNSPAAYQGNAGISLRVDAYGWVFEDRDFPLNLRGGQTVPLVLPCDLTPQQMRTANRNKVTIQVSIDPANRIRESREDNNRKIKEWVYGVTELKLTLVGDTHQGACGSGAQIRITARVAASVNAPVTEAFVITVTEKQSQTTKMVFGTPWWTFTANPGTFTRTVDFLIPPDILAKLPAGGGQLLVRALLLGEDEMDALVKNIYSNVATFTLRCQ
jgi:hypothetical protein